MRIRIFYFLIVLFVCLFPRLHAQTIQGRVVDVAGEPMEGYISLSPLGNPSEIYKIELTDSQGIYLFEEVEQGVYEIFFSFYGTMNKYPDILNVDSSTAKIELNDMVIADKSIELDEVLLVQKKPLVEQKVDRTVVNVEAIISNQGTSALEVLEKAPGLQVDQNGGISLRGRTGVSVYINNKPTYLSGSDLAAYLQSLPSSTLEAIEIMTNAPAQYDAAGNAGVINIRTKRQNIFGFNAGLNFSLAQHKYSETRIGLNLNFRKNKFNIYGNIGYDTRNGFVNFTVDRDFRDTDGSIITNFDQYSHIRRKGYQFVSTVGIDFYQSDNTTWGVVFNGISRHPDSKIKTSSEFANTIGILDSLTHSVNVDEGIFENGSVNLNFRHGFNKEGQRFSMDFDHIVYHTGNSQNFDDRNFDDQNQLKSEELLIGDLKSNIKISSVKGDYAHPLGASASISLGAKTSYTETDNSAVYFFEENNTLVPDYDKTNRFLYDENIHAGYINLNKEFNKLSLQLGLRYEKTISKGHQLGNEVKRDSSFRRAYDGLFPTAFALYKIDSLENHQIRINYGRRIDRPYYQDLNPFISPLNKFTFYVGNPLLLPSYSDNIELSYIFKKKTTVTLGYSSSRDQVNETIEIDDGIYFSRPGNIGSTEILKMALEGNYDIRDWFRLQFYSSLDFIEIESDFYDGPIAHKGTNGYFQGLCSFSLPKDWTIQVDGNYRTRITRAQFLYGSKGALNLGISKKLSERSTLRLSVNDLLYTNINRGEIRNLELTDASYLNLGDTRRVLLSYSLLLGKEFSSRPRHNAEGAEDEKNRVKN